MTDGKETLLSPADPNPVTLFNETGNGPVALVCEHAGWAIPEKLEKLGLPEAAFDTHIAFDIGARLVAEALANLLNAPLVMQNYSRLVVDCNRPDHVHDAIPLRSDGVDIPANIAMDTQERQQRLDEIFSPFDQTMSEMLNRSNIKMAFSVHSFTPQLGEDIRPWDISFLFRKDTETSHDLAKTLARRNSELTIGMNEPYQICEKTDWFVPHYGEQLGLAHSLIEIRNDHIRTPQACQDWAENLAAAIISLQTGK